MLTRIVPNQLYGACQILVNSCQYQLVYSTNYFLNFLNLLVLAWFQFLEDHDQSLLKYTIHNNNLHGDYSTIFIEFQHQTSISSGIVRSICTSRNQHQLSSTHEAPLQIQLSCMVGGQGSRLSTKFSNDLYSKINI